MNTSRAVGIRQTGCRRENEDDAKRAYGEQVTASLPGDHPLNATAFSLQPRYSGGILEIFKCLANARQELDHAKLVEYANHFGSKSLGSRLGYLLSQLGIQAEGLAISEGSVRLDPLHELSKVWDSHWRVNVNVPQRELNLWQES